MSDPTLSNPGSGVPNWLGSPSKARDLEKHMLNRTTGKAHTLLTRLFQDPDIHAFSCYANAVSVRRLGYNDHGPVHARVTTYSGIKLLELLQQGGIKTSLEKEHVGAYEDSQIAVILASFLHDLGMGVRREDHERHSLYFADEFIIRYLEEIYDKQNPIRHVVRALAHEAIIGHMGAKRIHSVEAGIVLVADGTDMTRGRSSVPSKINVTPMVGDIHRYSANSITRVHIGAGQNKPARITVHMEDLAGIFQVEEVLMSKVKASPIMPYLEICAQVADQAPLDYLL